MNRQSARLEGVPGTEAVGSKRGYYYQDVATALAWAQLRDGETLVVEVAEDLAVDMGNEAVIHQVKHLAASATLNSVLEFLDRALELRELNPGKRLAFVYRTTGRIGTEKQVAHRPAGEEGLSYWSAVQKLDRAPLPLIAVLKTLAPAKSRLHVFLAAKSTDEIVAELIASISWATREPDTSRLLQNLEERLSEIAHREYRVRWGEGRRLVPAVIDAVTRVSQEAAVENRELSYVRLLTLLETETRKSLPHRDYQQLQDAAALAENPPTEQVEADVERRLARLKAVRFFPEAEPTDLARRLASDVRDGGACQLGGKALRALALSWCARILSEDDHDLASALVGEAKVLSPQSHVTLVEALLLSKEDVAKARKLIVDERDGLAQTIRYALARREGLGEGLRWIETSGLMPTHLDADGDCVVLGDMVKQGQWDGVLGWLDRVPAEAFDACPALLWVGANVLVALSVAPQLRSNALQGPPVANELPLMDRADALALRRRAATLFRRFHNAAQSLDVPDTAASALEYCLWLQLQDRTTTAAAATEVLQHWNAAGAEEQARWVPLALVANLRIDRQELAQQIDQRAATYGALNLNDARARVALLLAQRAADSIDLWPAIREHLRPYFDPGFLENWEVQALALSGRQTDAAAALANATHLPDVVRQRLALELTGVVDEAAVEALRAAAAAEPSPATLQTLVAALQKAKQLPEAINRAFELFEMTQDREHAEDVLRLLAREERWDEVVVFLDQHPVLVEQSRALAAMYFDALFRRGRWSDAQRHSEMSAELSGRRHEIDLQLSLYSGKWEGLGLFLETIQADPDLSVEDRRRFARLATALGRTAIAKRLAKAAVEAAPDAPSVLLDGYMLAVRGRWDDDEEVASWLHRAIALSDENGPVHAKDLAELVELAPQWRTRTEALSKGIASAEMYLGLVAQHLNRPLATFLLANAVANQNERDPRRRTPISAFAAVRRVALLRPQVIALDQTALLTLGRLGLLPKLLQAFERIYVPHATGVWLFSEYAEVQFHQPGRIHDARRLLRAIAADELRMAPVGGEHSRRLAAEVGVDLAQLLQAVTLHRETLTDTFVVRPGPVHRAASLMREEANLGETAPLFRSCLEIVRSLHFHGLLADDAHERALAYLTQNDKGFTHDSTVPLAAALYLDDVTVSYFQHLNLWKPLADAGFKLFIHPDVKAEAAALEQLDAATQKVIEVLDALRRFLVDGQNQDKVSFLRKPAREAGDSDENAPQFLLLQAIEHEPGVEAVIVDDRAANKFSEFTYPDGSVTALGTTLDVLEWLQDTLAIDEKEWMNYRTELRRSGYLFIPVTARELGAALRASQVHDGVLIESPALRALRENHLQAQAAEMLRIPDELPWLVEIGAQIQQAIVTLWSNGDDNVETAVRAGWLVEYGRWDGFLGQLPGPWEAARLLDIDAISVSRLLFNNAVLKRHRRAHSAWLDKEYLEPIRRSKPRLFDVVYQRVAQQFNDLSGYLATNERELPQEQLAAVAADVCKSFVSDLPQSLRDRIFEDRTLLKQLGLNRSTRITVHTDGKPSFDTSAFYTAVEQAYAGAAPTTINDEAGDTWELHVAATRAVVCRHPATGREFRVPHAQLLDVDAGRREAYLTQWARDFGLTPDNIGAWLEEVRQAPLHPHRFDLLERDLEDSPAGELERTKEAFLGPVVQSDLVPMSRRYYERLVPAWQGQRTLPEFVDALRLRVPASDPVAQVRHELLWSAHAHTAPVAGIAMLEEATLRALVSDLLPTIDLWSLTGLIEGMLARPDATQALRDLVVELITSFAAHIQDSGRVELTSRLGGMADGLLNTSGLFTGAPVYWRRLAALAHAAVLERAVLELGVPPSQLASWAHDSWSIFQTATLADVSSEPRWNGFMLAPEQLKQELIGRVLGVLECHREGLAEPLAGLAFGAADGSLEAQRVVFFSGLPGPLEGGLAIAQTLPEFLVEQFNTTLGDTSQALEFRVLASAHLAGLGTPRPEQWAKLTEIVKELALSDSIDVEANHWAALLTRLSLAAASSRDRPLADAVLRLIEEHSAAPLSLRLYAGITTCGVEAQDGEWAAAVASYVARCTAAELSREDAEYVLALLRILCDAKPVLRPRIAPIIARLNGVSKRVG